MAIVAALVLLALSGTASAATLVEGERTGGFAGRTVTARGAEEWPRELEALVRDFAVIYEKARGSLPMHGH